MPPYRPTTNYRAVKKNESRTLITVTRFRRLCNIIDSYRGRLLRNKSITTIRVVIYVARPSTVVTVARDRKNGKNVRRLWHARAPSVTVRYLLPRTVIGYYFFTNIDHRGNRPLDRSVFRPLFLRFTPNRRSPFTNPGVTSSLTKSARFHGASIVGRCRENDPTPS